METLGRIRDKVTGLGSTNMDMLIQDLAAKANAINLRTAWIHAFESLGDAESARASCRRSSPKTRPTATPSSRA